MTLFLIYIIGTIFTFYYETEDIFLNKLNTSLQSTVVFSLCWPVSILFGTFVMWKEIIKNRGDKK
jgi:hypothetical protein